MGLVRWIRIVLCIFVEWKGKACVLTGIEAHTHKQQQQKIEKIDALNGDLVGGAKQKRELPKKYKYRRFMRVDYRRKMERKKHRRKYTKRHTADTIESVCAHNFEFASLFIISLFVHSHFFCELR